MGAKSKKRRRASRTETGVSTGAGLRQGITLQAVMHVCLFGHAWQLEQTSLSGKEDAPPTLALVLLSCRLSCLLSRPFVWPSGGGYETTSSPSLSTSNAFVFFWRDHASSVALVLDGKAHEKVLPTRPERQSGIQLIRLPPNVGTPPSPKCMFVGFRST